MLALERQKIILDYLSANHVATTKCLSDLTNASLATLRRDLNLMDRQGLIRKTHGGAQSIDVETIHSVPQIQPGFPPEADTFFSYKDIIARKAVEFINSNDILFVGAGMTCNLLCKYLNENNKENITIVTTNITAVIELASNPHFSILLLGGTIHAGQNHIETLDEYTIQSLEKYYFDKVFFTVDGVDLNNGYSIINRTQLPLYNHLLKNSRQIYLLANDGKYDRRTFTHLCNMDDIPNIITNKSINPKYLDYYREHDIKVYTV